MTTKDQARCGKCSACYLNTGPCTTISSGESDKRAVSVTEWIRNNYQDHTTVDSLCDALDRTLAALATQPAEFKGRAYDFTVSRDYDISMPPSVQAGTESKACASVGVEPVAWVVECRVGDSWVPQWPARFAEADAAVDLGMFKTPFKRVTPLVRAALSSPAPAVGHSIAIDFKQATELLEMFGGDAGEITLTVADGTAGNGIYAHYTNYPEEGSEFLGVSDGDATPPAAPAATEAPSKPFAYYIHIAAEQRGEFVHDLDEALDDLTNCECKITELFDHAPPVAECPYCHACWPECLHCDGTGRAVQAPSLREVCAALLSLIRRDAPHLSGKVLGEAEAALAAVGASVQPVLASLSDENRSIGRAINRAAAELPPGAQIRIELERDAGTVYWLDQKHGAWRHIDSGGEPFSSQIDTAVDAALASSTPTKGGEAS